MTATGATRQPAERTLHLHDNMWLEAQEIDAVIDALDVDTDLAAFVEEEDTVTQVRADASGVFETETPARARTEPEASVIIDPALFRAKR